MKDDVTIFRVKLYEFRELNNFNRYRKNVAFIEYHNNSTLQSEITSLLVPKTSAKRDRQRIVYDT